jgi:PAS domain S-box-containing protein
VNPATPALRERWLALTNWLPRGTQLPADIWDVRHRGLLAVLWAHAILLPVFGIYQEIEREHLVWESLVLPCLAVAAGLGLFPRRVRSGIVAGGLITSSALLTHFSGGYIEAHFHFFVMVALITLYQDWVPFLLSVAFVALHHGVMGTLDPASVYNHPDAIAHPWVWAGIHAGFILGLSIACIVIWRANEVTYHDLRTKERQLESAQHLASMGSWSWDLKTNVLTASAEMNRLLGKPGGPRRWTYEAMRAVLHPDDVVWVEKAANEAVQTGQVFDHEYRLLMPDGTVRWVSTRARLESDAQGTGGIFAGTSIDVTARRAAEEERRRNDARVRQIERLEELNQFKTSFLNQAAHEMGTPLTPIKVQLHLLRGTGDEAQRKSLEMLERNFNRVTALTKDLLDAARTQSSKLILQPRPVSLAVLVCDAAESRRAEAEAKKIRFEVDAKEPCDLEADARRVSQVLDNLLSNAIKFTPKGGRVSIALRQGVDEATVEVRDTGFGLNEQQAQRLFQPFSRAHSDDPNAPDGTGLGLFISRGIVEAHGGRIWCQSDGPGRGTTFTFTLPTRPRAEDVPRDTVPDVQPHVVAPSDAVSA